MEKEQSHTFVESMIDKFEANTVSMVQNLCIELREIVQKSEEEANSSNDIKKLQNHLLLKYERLLQVQNILENGFQ